MKNFGIIYMDGYNTVVDIDTQETIFSTVGIKIDIDEVIDMKESVIDNIVNIWNTTKSVEENLGSGGLLDEYLLDEGLCTQEEREIIVESLYAYALKIN